MAETHDDLVGPRRPADRSPGRTGRRLLVLAWIGVALIPVGFVGAMVVGEALIAAAGYPSGATPPLGAALRAALPALLIMLAPAAAALGFGLAARRRGAPGGTAPAWIGAGIILAAIAMNLLPRLLLG